MMSERHPGAEFAAVERCFLSPFSRIHRPSAADGCGEKNALQKG